MGTAFRKLYSAASPLADGITVGLSAALPALIHTRTNGKKDPLKLIENKGKFIGVSCSGASCSAC